MARSSKSADAYVRVDISGLPRTMQAAIIEDAQMGGKEFGIRVVEESVNGPAKFPIYGYYLEPAEAGPLLWEAAKVEFGIVEEDVEVDPEAIQAQADAAAEAEREREEEALRKIIPDDDGKGGNKANRNKH